MSDTERQPRSPGDRRAGGDPVITDEDTIEIVVEQVFDSGTTAIGIGRDTTTGEVIRFAGDWRPMADLAQAVALADADDDLPVAVVQPWQVLSRA